jgi:hypothetical protein
VFLLLLFFRMEYLMNSEHFYFPVEFLLRKRRLEYTITDEIIELNSVWNRILVSCVQRRFITDFLQRSQSMCTALSACISYI